jgi:hypothetical protein
MLIGAAGASESIGTVERLSIPDQDDVAPGSLVVVPVEATAPHGIESVRCGIEYSSELLSPLAVYTTPLTRGFDLRFDLDTPGYVSIDLRGDRLVFESGAIAWVLFQTVGVAGDRSELVLRNALLNDSEPRVRKSGSIEIDQEEVTLSIPTDLTSANGEVVTASLSADDAAGILAMDIRIEYDPLVLQAISVARTPISQSFSLTPNLTAPGVIVISLFGTQPMAGSGPILDIDFDVVGATGQSTALDLVSADINEGAIVAVLSDGLFTVCDNTDFDDDGVSLCDGDCDDEDGGRYPGNPEIGCDGIDQDCDGATSDILDGDNDTFDCDVDCNDGDPAINPDAEEVCDGVDNDCDFGIDNVPPPVQLVQVDAGGPSEPTFAWNALADATGYDVLRGNLGELRASGGDFTQAPDACLGEDIPDTFIDDFDPVPSFDGFWYIVRPVNCGGNGSYESGAMTQDGLRDAEANASPQACN